MNKKTFLDKGELKRSEKDGEKASLHFPGARDMFSSPANLIPGIGGVSGGRVLLGSKATLQAITLKHRQAPLVPSTSADHETPFVNQYGKNLMTVMSDCDGIVSHVDKDEIVVKDKNNKEHHHDIYDNFLLGRKTFMHNYPKVKVGDVVKKGQMLATSNYTDDHGVLALGTNLRTAVMPYRSGNYEDAWVVTESGAKKLEAEQLLKFRAEKKLGIETNKAKYISLFPNKFFNKQLDTIDQDGCVKKGTIIHNGDPIILSYSPKALKSTDIALGKLSKVLKNAFRDQTQSWHYEHPGEVVDVSKAGDLVTVTVKTNRGLSVGDKVSNAWGAKGVVGAIIPDSLAPQDEHGKPVDILLNSMSITSRVAPALAVTIGLGKVAEKIGKPIPLAHFNKEPAIKKAINLLKEHGLSDTEKLYDPVSGKHVEVLTGPLYFTRLIHIAEDKESSSSEASGYCFDDQTDVLTRRGWINWADVSDDDQFFTVDVNNSYHYTKATEVIRQKYEGLMYGFDGKYANYLVTPNHRFLFRPEGKNNFEEFNASEIHGKRGSIKVGGFTSYEEVISTTETLIPAVETIGKHFDQVSINNKQLSKFIGIWLSEGSVVFNAEEGRYRVYVWQDQKANPVKYAQINEMLSALPFVWRTHKGSEGINKGFYTSHAGLAKFVIDNFGKYCENKRIPQWVFDLGQECRELVLSYLLMGDGSVYQNGNNSCSQYFTCSKSLADDINHLCIASGKYSSIITRVDRENLQYTLTITDKKEARLAVYPGSKYDNYYTQEYNGMIYCASIPETQTLFVRRKNKCLLSLNSWDRQPTRSGDESTKRIGNLSTASLLSHGATAVLRDFGLVKATQNDEFWRNLKLGLPAPSPKVPFIFDKFIASLHGAGVKVDKKGDIFSILPMTDNEVAKLSSGPIMNAKTFKAKGDKVLPEAGGLFDPAKVGVFGDKYNHVDLNFNVPNPISEDFLRKMLGVTQKAYEDMVVKGAIAEKLATVDVDKKIEEYKNYLKSGKKTHREDSIKVLSFLRALKENKLHPKDLMLSKIPVIPAQYRPMMVQGDMTLTSPVNTLYKELIQNNEALRDMEFVPEETQMKLKQDQYNAVRAIFGLGEAITTKSKEKGIKGLLSTTLGTQGGSAKTTMFQAKVVNKPLNLVGRAVLTPDAKLDLDEAAIPQDTIWKIYNPFIIRRLVMKGVPATKAAEYVKAHNPLAIQALAEELRHRPGIISRDPSLHKYNLTGFYLKPNPNPKDKTIKLNPLVFKSFNADNDGDQLNVNIPPTEESRQEVIDKMLPSKNLLSPKTFQPMYTPGNESALGLFQSSTEDNKNEAKKYRNSADVFRDFMNGKLDIGDRIELD